VKAAYHRSQGGLQVLQVGDLPVPLPESTEVLIRVRATSLDRVDIFTRGGSHGMTITGDHIGGRDVAGEVVARGDEVSGIEIGDAVLAATHRAHAEFAVAPSALTLPIPSSLSFEAAAALPTAGRSAWAALIDRARVQAGETVLVTAVSSGVGSYALQIAQAAGARVIATAGSARKRAQALELGAAAAIDHYRDDVRQQILEATDGAGVDVVCDHVGAPLWKACITTLRPWGRFVTTGVTAGHRAELHLGQVFLKGITITGIGRPSQDQIRRHLSDLLAAVASGTVRPIVAATFSLDEIARAHELMERGDFFGKIVIRP